MKVTLVHLEDELHRKLKQLALDMGLTLKFIVSDAVGKWLADADRAKSIPCTQSEKLA